MSVYDPVSERAPPLADLTVGVWGLGKMGLPLAAVLADRGATVRGVDIDPAVVDAVNSGRPVLDNEPEVPELLSRHGGDRLRATTDGVAAAEAVDLAVILVPTVLDEDSNPDLAPVIAAGEDIARGLGEGDFVVLESTVPPGTTAGDLRETLETSGLAAGEEFGLAFCPERTSSGRVVRDLTESYPKIVGGIDDTSTRVAAGLYRQFNEPGVVEMPSATAAEAVKVFEGVYRDVNIALANELATVCEEWGIDARAIFDAANTQPYCDIHEPGLGVGGHCIPVYPHFVTSQTSAPLLEQSRSINDGMPGHALELLRSRLAAHGRNLADARVLVLGLTYRPGVREIRYSPAVALVDLLVDAGAATFAHDPLLDDGTIADCGATPASIESAENIDAVVLATGHETYGSLDPGSLSDLLRTPVLLDGRGFFDRDRFLQTGIDYVSIGDGTTMEGGR